MRSCPFCGAAVADNARLCWGCGREVPPTTGFYDDQTLISTAPISKSSIASQIPPQPQKRKNWWSKIGRIALIIFVLLFALVTAGVTALLARSPSLTASGLKAGNSITVGHTFTIAGNQFIPGGNVTLTRDENIPIAPVTASTQKNLLSRPVLTILELQHLIDQTSIPVKSDGTFEAEITVGSDWAVGQHSVVARENIMGRSASFSLTVEPGWSPAPKPSPTSKPTIQPTARIATPTPTPTHTPTATPTRTPTATPTRVPTRVPTPTPTPMPTQVPTSTPTQAPTPTQIPTPTQAPTPTPEEPTPTPTQAPTPTPTPEEPTPTPTLEEPTSTPTQAPTSTPTLEEPTPTPIAELTPPMLCSLSTSLLDFGTLQQTEQKSLTLTLIC